MIIELTEKKDRCRRLTNYRRPITLLNVGLKNLSKAFSEKLKEVFPSSFSSQQTVYLKNSHNVESGRLISDIIETAPLNNLEGFLVEMDTEKTFESLDHTFLVSILKKIRTWSKLHSWDKNSYKKSGILGSHWRKDHELVFGSKELPANISLSVSLAIRTLIFAFKNEF